MNHHVVLNRPLLTPPFLVLGAFGLTAIVLLLVRFFSGMGAVTNLSGGYPWGIWVVYDIVVGTAFACGGYALAVAVYVFNNGRYHPLMRAAILTTSPMTVYSAREAEPGKVRGGAGGRGVKSRFKGSCEGKK